jgi:DNA-binding Lrp family transcriptional regulator
MSFELLRINFAESKLPVFKENKNKGIMYFGEANDFPQHLLEFYNRSPKHGAIVRQKARFVAGEETIVEGNPNAVKIIDYVNPYEGVQEFKNKLALDYELFNGFAYEVHYNKLGQLAALYHIDFSKVRTLDHELYMYAEDWKKAKHEDMKHYRPFNPKKAQPMEVQLFYFREYAPGLGIYPLPPYQHCLQYIEIDVEIANFHNNNIRNGFSNGTLVQLFKGQPSQEIAYEFERKFKAKTTGTDNAGGVLIQFNEMNEKEATINHLQPSEMDKQFLQLNETVQDEIFVGHNFPKILLGYATEGALGQRNEMIQAYELLHKSYINRRQSKIETCLETTLETVYPGIQISTKDSEFLAIDYVALYGAGIATVDEAREQLGLGETEQKVIDAAQKTIDNINSLSPLVANNVLANMTVNEKRALAGLPPIEGGDALATTPSTAPEPTTFTAVKMKCECELWKDSDIEVFSKFGVSADEFEDVPMLFALDTKEKKVLAVVTADEKATVKNIADAVKLDEPEVIEILKKLQSDGKLNWTNNAIKITDIGRADIQDEGLPKIEVRYKYDLSPDAPPLMPGGKSREFCIKMMETNKLYTRQEIDQISGIVGYNAWLRRGGWYTVPNSEPPLHIPHCRHEWSQKVVRRKG